MANRTQALWIVIIALAVSCAVLLSLVIKSSYFKGENNAGKNSSSEENQPGIRADDYPQRIEKDHGHKPEEAKAWHDFKLPTHIVPLHYDLYLFPNMTTERFYGEVNITVNVTKVTNVLIVHKYKTLNVTRSALITSGSDRVVVDAFEYIPNEFWVMETKTPLKPDKKHVLHLTFDGPLTGSIVGFYKSTYRNNKLNKTSSIVSSKFQPTFARRAFPCFDEPNWKSTFTVALVHEENMVSLSNMPSENVVGRPDGLLETRFQKSTPMVTYLVCFVIGDYEYRETFTTKGTKFRVYATPDQIGNVEYALNLGSAVLSHFEEYFGIPYPLPKQDMIAIPDFVAGAMEHWGLITYRETNLLFNENEASSANKQRIATVVSHELAHMWFGNLVTMEWWDDLWLNEGFASYIEYKGVVAYEHDWDMMSQFLTSDLQTVMSLDSKDSSHPIIQPVHHPDQINEIFDRIAYSKGASVLRMLEFFLGPDDFRKGVQDYLRKYAYGNAKTEDLWRHLTHASRKRYNVSSLMSSWTKQKGYPVVTVSRNDKCFTAKQEPFYENRKVAIDSNDHRHLRSTWSIPLTYITNETDKETMVWLKHRGPESFNCSLGSSDVSWMKFNVRQRGYYIVNYELADWMKLKSLLHSNHQLLSAEDRSSLIHDAFRLSRSGYVDYDLALDLVKYLVNETHYVPWKTAYYFLREMFSFLSDSESYSKFKIFVRRLTAPLFAKLGWEDTGSHLDRRLRSLIVKLSCKSGNKDCLEEASRKFMKWRNGESIVPNLRALVYEYGMQENGDYDSWQFMWNRYRNVTSAQEKSKLLYGLSMTRIPWLLRRYLKRAENEDNVKRQDYFSVLIYISSNPAGHPLTWLYLREKWPELVDRFTLNERYLGRAVKAITQSFTNQFSLSEVIRYDRLI
ncbi:ENPEP (predicted) [Pycnogonum litorale]